MEVFNMKEISSHICVKDVNNWKNDDEIEFKSSVTLNSSYCFLGICDKNTTKTKFSINELVKCLSSKEGEGNLKLNIPNNIKYKDGEEIKFEIYVYDSKMGNDVTKYKRVLDIIFDNEGNYIRYKEYSTDSNEQPIKIKFISPEKDPTYWEVSRADTLLGYIYEKGSSNLLNASWPTPQIFSKDIEVKNTDGENLNISGEVKFIDKNYTIGEGKLNNGKFEYIKNKVTEGTAGAVCKLKIAFFEELKKYQEKDDAFEDIKELKGTSISTIAETIYTKHNLESNKEVKNEYDKYCKTGKDSLTAGDFDSLKDTVYSNESYTLVYLYMLNDNNKFEKEEKFYQNNNAQQQSTNLSQTLGGYGTQQQRNTARNPLNQTMPAGMQNAQQQSTLEDAFKELGLKFVKDNNKSVPPEIDKRILLKMIEDNLIRANEDDKDKTYSGGCLYRDTAYSNLRHLIFGKNKEGVIFNEDGSIYNLNFFARYALNAPGDYSKIFDMYDRCKKLCKMEKNRNFKNTIISVTTEENLKNLEENLEKDLSKTLKKEKSTDTSGDASNENKDTNEDRTSEVILVYKELQELYKIATDLKLISKESSTNDLHETAATCVSNNSIENFLEGCFKEDYAGKIWGKIANKKGLTLEEQLNLLKRFLLRTKKKQGSAIKRGLHKFYKIAKGDESIKVRECFKKAGKYIVKEKCLEKGKNNNYYEYYKNFKKCFNGIKVKGYLNSLDDTAFKNNLSAINDGTYFTKNGLMAGMFASFIGLKNETNIIAACDGLKMGGIKGTSGNMENYIKIRKGLKAMCTSSVSKDELIDFLRKSCYTKLGMPAQIFNNIIKVYDGAWEGGMAPFPKK